MYILVFMLFSFECGQTTRGYKGVPDIHKFISNGDVDRIISRLGERNFTWSTTNINGTSALYLLLKDHPNLETKFKNHIFVSDRVDAFFVAIRSISNSDEVEGLLTLFEPNEKESLGLTNGGEDYILRADGKKVDTKDQYYLAIEEESNKKGKSKLIGFDSDRKSYIKGTLDIARGKTGATDPRSTFAFRKRKLIEKKSSDKIPYFMYIALHYPSKGDLVERRDRLEQRVSNDGLTLKTLKYLFENSHGVNKEVKEYFLNIVLKYIEAFVFDRDKFNDTIYGRMAKTEKPLFRLSKDMKTLFEYFVKGDGGDSEAGAYKIVETIIELDEKYKNSED